MVALNSSPIMFLLVKATRRCAHVSRSRRAVSERRRRNLITVALEIENPVGDSAAAEIVGICCCLTRRLVVSGLILLSGKGNGVPKM